MESFIGLVLSCGLMFAKTESMKRLILYTPLLFAFFISSQVTLANDSYGFIQKDFGFSDRVNSEINRKVSDHFLIRPPDCSNGRRVTEDNIWISKATLRDFFLAGHYHDLFTNYGKITKIDNPGPAYAKANGQAQMGASLFNDLFEFIDQVYPNSSIKLSYARPANYNAEYERFVRSKGYTNSERNQFDLMESSLRKVIVSYVGHYIGLIRAGRACDISYEKFFAFRLYSQGAYLLFDRENRIDSRFHRSLRLVKNLLISVLSNIRPYTGSIYIGTSIPKEEWSTLRPGEPFAYSSFMSGSAAHGFKKFVRNAVIVVRKNISGVLISSISTYPLEGEVLWSAPEFRLLSASVDQQNILWLEVEEMR
jgi:hypothetical protein